MTVLGKIIIGLLVGLVGLAVAGAVYQSVTQGRDLARFPAPGRMVDVDGIPLHLDCRGTGVPTVVLESGLLNTSVAWYRVLDPIAAVTRVCAYDRPGLGWSGPSPGATRAEEVAARLKRLLDAAGETGPFVLGGWSAGGIYQRSFVRQYPQAVLGLVLVDSSHEQQGYRLPQEDQQDPGALLSACRVFQPVGVVRALDMMSWLNVSMGAPQNLLALMNTQSDQTRFCATAQAEFEGFNQDVRQAEPPAPLGDLPLVVLSQGRVIDSGGGLGMNAAQFRVWQSLQKELAGLSSVSAHTVVAEAGHGIQLEAPLVVVDAVLGMVRRVRAGTGS